MSSDKKEQEIRKSRRIADKIIIKPNIPIIKEDIKETVDKLLLDKIPDKLKVKKVTFEIKTDPNNSNNTPDTKQSFKMANETPNRTPFVQQTYSPGEFSGNENENVKEFIIRYERTADIYAWDEKDKIKHLPCYLNDTAIKFFNTYQKRITETTTWEQVKQALTKAFEGLARSEMSIFNLSQRSQGTTESIEDYYFSILELCDIVDRNMTENVKTKHLLRGLRPNLLERVMPMDPKNPEELLDFVRRFESARYLATRSYEASPAPAEKTNMVTELMTKLSELVLSGQNQNKDQPRDHGRDRSRERDSRPSYHANSRDPSRDRYLPRERGPTYQPYNRPHYNVPPRRVQFQNPPITPPNYTTPRPMHQTNPPNQGNRVVPGSTTPVSSRTRDGRAICYQCGQAGHIARNCRRPQNPNLVTPKNRFGSNQ